MKYWPLFSIIFLAACNSTSKPAPSPEVALVTMDEVDSSYQVQHPEVDLFFKKPQLADFKLSPSGQALSFLKRSETGQLELFVRIQGKDKQLTFNSVRDIRSQLWLDDNHLGFRQDDQGNEVFILHKLNIHTGEQTQLTGFSGESNVYTQRIKNQPGKLIVYLNKIDRRYFHAYSLDIETGSLIALFDFNRGIFNPLLDNDGNTRIVSKWNANDDGKYEKLDMLYKGADEIAFTRFETLDLKQEVLQIIGFNDNKQEFYALSNIDSNTTELVKYDYQTLTKQSVFSHPDNDVAQTWQLPGDEDISMVQYNEGKGTLKPLTAQGNQLDQLIRAHTDLNYYISSWSDDGALLTIHAYSDIQPGQFFIVNQSQATVRELGQSAPWLNQQPLANMTPISFKNRNNALVNGFLTRPINAKDTPAPMVVLPHGGPFGIYDTWGFNPEVQLLASQGYAVLQVNYHGSGSYGRDYLLSSELQMGKGVMQHDLTDGVKWAIEQGIADPRQVRIYGASYGGYATLAGLTFTPDLYACGISYVGISNLLTFLTNMEPSWGIGRDFWMKMVGNPYTARKDLEAISPYHHADKIKVPLFIAHGANDPRVKQQESDQMVSALRQRGVTVNYMLKQDEGHGFVLEHNQQHFYDEMLNFFAQCPANPNLTVGAN
ncbi:alpha/beta hydrolase family protein [Motilimonas pumila]|uniref:S9 family peptidase n=1 Tax=Motilimonas pumila TaxID=2303987 RepID=A0A418YIT4_9GAMM|nr:S9 family peptidase [Motilimonas pumila]RJG50556.1 S9 family peptidase [Motilimonas pumila]